MLLFEFFISNVHTIPEENEEVICCEKKVISGDNKTEKNMFYGILSKTDEKDSFQRLGFILPSHEYFHQKMVVADCATELFRDSSRGLEGGFFFITTLLQRKEARTGKGKDSIDD